MNLLSAIGVLLFLAVTDVHAEDSRLRVEHVSFLYDGGSLVIIFNQNGERSVLYQKTPLSGDHTRQLRYGTVPSDWRLQTDAQIDALPIINPDSLQWKRLLGKIEQTEKNSGDPVEIQNASEIAKMLRNPKGSDFNTSAYVWSRPSRPVVSKTYGEWITSSSMTLFWNGLETQCVVNNKPDLEKLSKYLKEYSIRNDIHTTLPAIVVDLKKSWSDARKAIYLMLILHWDRRDAKKLLTRYSQCSDPDVCRIAKNLVIEIDKKK